MGSARIILHTTDWHLPEIGALSIGQGREHNKLDTGPHWRASKLAVLLGPAARRAQPDRPFERAGPTRRRRGDEYDRGPNRDGCASACFADSAGRRIQSFDRRM